LPSEAARLTLICVVQFGKVLFGVAALVGGAYAADQAGYIDLFSNPAVKDTLQAGTKVSW
jgi:hypothetical protein